MTQTETEIVPEQDVPGRTRWGVFLAILAVPTLVVAALLALLIAWLFTDDSVDTGVRKASCAEAFAYGGAKPPTGVRDLTCSLEAGQGSRYEASFLMRNAEVSAWVAANYPDGPALRNVQCEGTDVYACMSRGPAAGRSGSVQMEIAHDSDKWSEVRYKAFTP